MDDSVIFSIDTSNHSDGTGAPVRLELEIRVETHGVGVMNLTAIFPQRLTDSLAEDIQPEWNTEGDTLLFKSSRDLEEGLYEIYKLTPDGSEPSRVNTEQSYHGYPGWSPDGTHVVFNSWVYGNESGNRQMEIFTANISTGETHRVTDNSAFDDSGRWSPDGSEIIFYSNRDGTMDLWKVPVSETGEPTGPPVKLVGTDAREHCGRWSSDGEWIVYESDQSGNNDIWVVPSDGEESTQVTFDDYEDGYPAWSPDGTNIVYNSLRGINGDLHILSLADGVLHRLTSDPAIDAHPTWSADGRHIAFHSDRSGNFDIWVVEIPLINSNESS
jgi:TolB protein